MVKADGYGHGAAASARAALRGGASWLAVAGAREAVELRRAGFEDVRILVMGALSEVELREALKASADVVVWHADGVRAVAQAGGGRVHVKLDSGMGRLGTRDPEEASSVVAVAATPWSRAGRGDDPLRDRRRQRRRSFFERQLALFARWASAIKADHPQIVVHAANSAATLARQQRALRHGALRDRRLWDGPVRRGPGCPPAGAGARAGLLRGRGQGCAPGQSAGYGRRFVAERDTYLGVLPIGYGDGWRRGLSNNADVLIGGSPPARGDREHGQHHRRPRRRRMRRLCSGRARRS